MTKITIILLGESGVGKSTILCRLKTGEFQEPNLLKATCPVDFQVTKLTLEGEEITLFIWDTAGTERYKSLVRSYYRRGEGVLLVYDVTNPETFYELSSWLSELRANNKEAEVLIAGNKNEDPSKNSVGVSMVKSFAQEENLEYMEMSAKSGNNVEEAFLRLAKKVLIAKRILTNEASNCEEPDKCDSLDGNGIYEKINQPDELSSLEINTNNILKEEDPDVIRLDATPTVQSSEKKGYCC